MSEARISGEQERIREVYRSYDSSSHWRAKRDPRLPGNTTILAERTRGIRRVLAVAGMLPLDDRRVLDVGCGAGGELARLMALGAQPYNLYGIDLLPDRIEAARQAHPDIHFSCGNAEHLDFPDAHFDLVLLFTVFSSILDDEMARNVAYEVRRVLKPGGAVLWYDFRYNNPSNPNVRGMTKRGIRLLFLGFDIWLRTITLLPPLARRLGPLTPVLYPVLAAVPPLRTHYLGLLVKPGDSKQIIAI